MSPVELSPLSVPTRRSMKKAKISKRPADGSASEQTAANDAEERAARKRQALLSGKMGSVFSSSNVTSEPSQTKSKAIEGAGGESNTNSAILRGICLDTNIFDSVGKGGVPAKKKRVCVAVDSVVPNGDISLVRSGVPGLDFMLPVKFIDRPEMYAADKQKNFQGQPRVLVVDEFTKARFLGYISPAFYMDAPASSKGGGGGISSVHPGMPVEIRSGSVNFGNKDENRHKVYFNAKKCLPLKDEPYRPAELPMVMIEGAMHPNLMRWGAVAWSMAMRGFLTLNYDEPELVEQADACKRIWSGAKETIYGRLLEMSQRSTDEDTRAALRVHADRVNEMPILDLVKTGRVFAEEEYDSMYAPLVQTGMMPHCRWPKPFLDLSSGSVADCAYLPDYFCSAIVSAVEFTGNRVDLEFKLYFCFDKTKALKCINDAAEDDDKSPILHSGAVTSVCTNISKKQLAHLMGSMHVHKVDLAKEVLPVAESVYYAKVMPRDPSDENLEMDFPAAYAIDMPKTLSLFPKLSEEFVKENLTRGTGQYVPPELTEEMKIEMPKDISEMPRFSSRNYQELTYSSWIDDEHLRVPVGFEREFRVLYPGVLKHMEDAPILATDETKGIEKLQEMVAASASGANVTAYLKETCLVYAVLVEKKTL